MTIAQDTHSEELDESNALGNANFAVIQDATSSETDRQLAFAALVSMYGPRIENYALRTTRNPHDAEDVAQEVWLRAWKSRDTYSQGRLGSWLLAITRNTLINRYRVSKNKPAPISYDAEPEYFDSDGTSWSPQIELPDPESDPSDIVEGNEDVERVIAASAGSMPMQFHRALMLRKSGMSYQEIADHEGIPIGTVMSRLHRGRAMLRAAQASADEQPVER